MIANNFFYSFYIMNSCTLYIKIFMCLKHGDLIEPAAQYLYSY
jgi:hypothetical protein